MSMKMTSDEIKKVADFFGVENQDTLTVRKIPKSRFRVRRTQIAVAGKIYNAREIVLEHPVMQHVSEAFNPAGEVRVRYQRLMFVEFVRSTDSGRQYSWVGYDAETHEIVQLIDDNNNETG